MNNAEYKATIAQMRANTQNRIEAKVRELQASGKMVKGCKNAKMPKTIIKRMDRVPVQWKRRSNPTPLPLRRPLPCIHLGPIVEKCMYDDPTRDVRFCLNENHDHDRCAQSPLTKGHSCESCELYDNGEKSEDDPVPITDEPPLVASSVPRCDILRRFDHRNLFPNLYGMRFNPSIAPWKDGYAMVYRTGWKGSDIFICTTDKNFEPRGKAHKLELHHRHARYGREDPRLFWFRDQLHIAYAGVVAGGGRRLHTNILYARLNDRLKVERVFYPHYQRRNLWEKNWQFFEHDNKLYCVYSIAPHRILHIDGEVATDAYLTPTNAPWVGGEPRGGASPVLVDGEWYCFFHSRVDRKEIGRVYNTGLYTFENVPPFRVTRITPEPFQEADHTNKPGDQYAAVVFAGGAVLDGDRWIIANGIHDRWSEIHAFDAIDIDRRLVSVAAPSWCCPDAFRRVVTENEYRLPDYFAAGDAVIDHTESAGAVALAAWRKGSRQIHCYGGHSAPLRGVRPIPKPLAPAFQRNGDSIDGVALDDAIDQCHRAAWIAIDCGPAEVPILADCSILDRVRGVSVKWSGDIDPLIKILDRWRFNIRIFRREAGAGIIVGDRG